MSTVSRRIRGFRLAGLLAGLALISATLFSCGPKQPERPDVLFIIIDALRAENLPFYGYDKPTAPYMTELAKQGAVFDYVTCNGLWTRASVPSILTGQLIHTHGMTLGDLSENTKRVDRLDKDKLTFLEMAQKEGYRTGGFFVPGWYSEDFGFNQGFDQIITADEYKEFWYSRETLNQGNKGFDLRATDKYIAERASKWIAEPPADAKKKPFLAYLHINGAHGPYDTPEPEGTRFCEKSLVDTMRARFSDTYKIEVIDLIRQDPDGAIKRYLGCQYDAAILYTDGLIKNLCEAAQKRSKNLLVVITADHGQAMNERPYEYRHGTSVLPYHELTHIPFVMVWPKRIPPKHVSTRAQSVDIFPTMIRAMGGTLPQQPVDGADLMPLLDGNRWPGNPPPEDRLLVMEGDETYASVSVIEKDHKYIGILPTSEASFWLGNRLPAGFEALYDLSADEKEMKDISLAKPDVVNHLRQRADRECLLPMRGYHLVLVSDASKPMSFIRARVSADSEIDRSTIRYYNDDLPFDLPTVLAQAYKVNAVKGRAGLLPENVQASAKTANATPGTALPFYGAKSQGRTLKLVTEPIELIVGTPPYTATKREIILFGGWFKRESGSGLPKLRLLSKQGNIYGEVEAQDIGENGAWCWSYALVGEGLNELILSLACDDPNGTVFKMKNVFAAPARNTYSGLTREIQQLTATVPLSTGRIDLRFLTVDTPGSLVFDLAKQEVGSATGAMPLMVWSDKGFVPAPNSALTTADLATAYVPPSRWNEIQFAEPGKAYFYSTAEKAAEKGSMSKETVNTLKGIGYLGGDK